MIQTQQHLLSDDDQGLLREWLLAPGATVFLKVIKSEQATVQAMVGELLMMRNEEKAKGLADKAWELEFILEKFKTMIGEEKPYEFKTATLTP